jgi:chromosome segregation ATPase
MPNLRDRLPTRSSVQEISTQPSPEQALLSRTQELQSAIAELKGELSETQRLNQTLREENQRLAQENAGLKAEHVTQKRRLMEAEQTIRDLEDEIDKLRDEVDIGCIEAVRRARMELLIMRNGAERKVARQRQEHEAEIRKLSSYYRSQIDATREEAKAAKAREDVLRRCIFLLIVITVIIICAY